MEKKTIDIAKIDKNLAVQDNLVVEEEFQIINPKLSDAVKVYGLPNFKEERTFIRVKNEDLKRISQFSQGLLTLACNTSGGSIAFYSNTSVLKIRVKLSFMFHMSHMAYTGQAGFDLYRGTSFDNLVFYKASPFDFHKTEYEYTFFQNRHANRELFLLEFPLYASVESVELVFAKDATIEPADIFNEGRILIYGTSITQGGCASRPGNSFPMIIARNTNYEVINYGFSGNGKGEVEMAEIINQIPNVDLYILDYEANAGLGEAINLSMPVFVDKLREVNPTTPILVVSRIKTAAYPFDAWEKEECDNRRTFQMNFVKERAKKDPNIYFLDGWSLLGDIGVAGTVDGVHPNDAGFIEMARNLQPMVKRILKK